MKSLKSSDGSPMSKIRTKIGNKCVCPAGY